MMRVQMKTTYGSFIEGGVYDLSRALAQALIGKKYAVEIHDETHKANVPNKAMESGRVRKGGL